MKTDKMVGDAVDRETTGPRALTRVLRLLDTLSKKSDGVANDIGR